MGSASQQFPQETPQPLLTSTFPTNSLLARQRNRAGANLVDALESHCSCLLTMREATDSFIAYYITVLQIDHPPSGKLLRRSRAASCPRPRASSRGTFCRRARFGLLYNG
eukprot:3935971-Rhodomonas_salina.3